MRDRKESFVEKLYECNQHKRWLLEARESLSDIMPLDVVRYRDLEYPEMSVIDQMIFRFSRLQDTMFEKFEFVREADIIEAVRAQAGSLKPGKEERYIQCSGFRKKPLCSLRNTKHERRKTKLYSGKFPEIKSLLTVPLSIG